MTLASDANVVGCPCGDGLHYSSAETRRIMLMLVEALGPTVPVEVLGHGKWEVPRHYIALHGIKAAELPDLARRFGWKRAR